MENQEVKNWLLKNLNEGKKITVKWDCGGDEAFVYPFIDGAEVDYQDEIHEEFEFFLIKEDKSEAKAPSKLFPECNLFKFCKLGA